MTGTTEISSAFQLDSRLLPNAFRFALAVVIVTSLLPAPSARGCVRSQQYGTESARQREL